jgi:1,4-dihydroxy-2-naphthoate octaprenyltransferase
VSTPWKVWLAGARPRTLPAAVVPVVVGTAAGYLSSGHLVVATITVNGHRELAGALTPHHLSIFRALLALVVALGIQIGTNYVNDYADGERGTDEGRAGPTRLVARGLATAHEVKIAAAVAFGVAALAGFVLALTVTWWFIPLGLLCGLAGWAYTGGPRPYGYMGLGEVFVFLFFGLVATAGSAYVQHAPFDALYQGHVHTYAYPWHFVILCGVPLGFLAAALLQANNLRDIATDARSGKKTLAVRLGRNNAGLFYGFTLMATALSIGLLQRDRGWTLLALLALPLAIYPVRLAFSNRMDRRLLPMLGATSRLQLGVGLLLTIGILV